VVYEDVHDAKQACDKLNGFNFQNRYLVGMCNKIRRGGGGGGSSGVEADAMNTQLTDLPPLVLYHQPEKMARSKEDLAERQENLERLKQQHGIE
jgi:pre-mRNA branch site protein p14